MRRPLPAESTPFSPARQGRNRRNVLGGVVGETVHGMPQIGQLRKGLWVASGFGRHGLNTTAMAGQLVARSILWGDERWRLFSPFELVWAGGAHRAGRRTCDRDVGAGKFRRRRRAGPLSGRSAGPGTRSARRGWPRPTGRPEPGRRRRRRPPPGRPRPSARSRVGGAGRRRYRRAWLSQESEKIRDGSV